VAAPTHQDFFSEGVGRQDEGERIEVDPATLRQVFIEGVQDSIVNLNFAFRLGLLACLARNDDESVAAVAGPSNSVSHAEHLVVGVVEGAGQHFVIEHAVCELLALWRS